MWSRAAGIRGTYNTKGLTVMDKFLVLLASMTLLWVLAAGFVVRESRIYRVNKRHTKAKGLTAVLGGAKATRGRSEPAAGQARTKIPWNQRRRIRRILRRGLLGQRITTSLVPRHTPERW